jgi:hypothetical protein
MVRKIEKRDSVQWTQQITPRLFELLRPSKQIQKKVDEGKKGKMRIQQIK